MRRDTAYRRPMFRAVLATLIALVAFTGVYAQSDASTESFTASDGAVIHYLVEGRGDPVVLLHGITGTAASNWGAAGIIDRLAEEFQVIAVDQRGHGKSDKPHDPASYGERMALDVVDLLDHLRLQQANVVGYSMGGFITMKLIALAPDRLMSAVVGGAGWSSPDLRDAAMFDALARVEVPWSSSCGPERNRRPRSRFRRSVWRWSPRATRRPWQPSSAACPPST
ncbi:MAG: alpha/beta fold hydrolase [Acidobacteria bacterium]|nr:alpha/beta fold hydrolase [Acidobacteriota bacterium]